MRQWRLIYDSPASGALNMAVDGAILWAVAQQRSAPTLRFYAWNPPCLSLGYAQSSAEVDFARVAAAGWDVVRRPTGGRAILHADELTYSLALPAADDLASGAVIESYRRISAGLVAGLHLLGLDLRSERLNQRQRPTGPVCFETPSHYESTVQGRKLLGSAQVRQQTGILQHGSLPLSGDLSRICHALAYADESSRAAASQRVRSRALTLAEALGHPLDWRTAAAALAAGFQRMFAVEFQVDGLSPAEQEHAQHLLTTTYAADSFTRRR